MLSILLALTMAQDLVIPSQEPSQARPWVQIVEASCGEQHIRIEGYGVRRPVEILPKVLLDGEVVEDQILQPFLTDLARQGAVYRFQMLCEMGGITVRMTYAAEQPDGLIFYRGGMAFFNKGNFLSYTGLEELNDESFWFD